MVWPAVEKAGKAFPDISVMRAVFPKFTVPDVFFASNTFNKDLGNRLFVNAWDCWSMPGNGNSWDGSADGFWGRSTAISLLCWPLSNPQITYTAV